MKLRAIFLLMIIFVLSGNVVASASSDIGYKLYSDKVRTVRITSVEQEGTHINYQRSATGFLLTNGYIVTAKHVTDTYYDDGGKMSYEILFAFKDKSVDATLAAIDAYNDIAILKVDESDVPEGFDKFAFNESDFIDASYNDKYSTVGHPQKPDKDGDIMSYRWERVTGSVVATGRPTLVGHRNYLRTYNNTFTLSTATYPGQSGSAVIREDGKLLGIIIASNPEQTQGYAQRASDIMGLIETSNLKSVIFTERGL